ncbi:hypothetical protein, partial [Streptomyces avidinii]|uniref:hypothetical protein n=1 Tax=Streptomyces avidinii TaxID=1895 RepID=UPI002F9166D1
PAASRREVSASASLRRIPAQAREWNSVNGIPERECNSRKRELQATAQARSPGWLQEEVHRARACVRLGNPRYHPSNESDGPSTWQGAGLM